MTCRRNSQLSPAEKPEDVDWTDVYQLQWPRFHGMLPSSEDEPVLSDPIARLDVVIGANKRWESELHKLSHPSEVKSLDPQATLMEAIAEVKEGWNE